MLQTLPKTGVFDGIVSGDALVPAGADLEVKGIVSGDLHVEACATVRVTGIVKGRVTGDMAGVTISGIVGG